MISIGGVGGEGYRALQTEPMNDLQKRMWETHSEMTLLQAEVSKAGVRCQEVAEQVLAIAQRAGMEKFVYYRPALGQRWEGIRSLTSVSATRQFSRRGWPSRTSRAFTAPREATATTTATGSSSGRSGASG